MTSLPDITDPYERKARLYPALVALCPVVLVLYTWFGSDFDWKAFVAVLGPLAVVPLLCQLARDRGKTRETALYVSWGGMPSVTILRYADDRLSKLAKGKYHAELAARTGATAPTEQAEAENPTDADDIYRMWSDHLRTNTRDVNRYPLVFKELVNYGFRRNLLGLKPISLGLCILTMIATVVHGVLQFKADMQVSAIDVAAFLVIAGLTLVHALWVVPRWVRIPADAYAKELVETLSIQS